MNLKFTILFLVAGVSQAWTLIGPNTYGWEGRSVVFYVNYTNCSIEESLLTQYLDAAISAWNHVPTSDLTVGRFESGVTTTASEAISGTTTQTPLIVCESDFSGATGQPSDLVPATTNVTPDGVIRTALIRLNSQSGKSANIAEINPGKLVAMMAHEIGHALGLGHSSQMEALMYFSIANKFDADLTQDDIDGITYLYPRNEIIYGPMGCASAKNQGGSGSLLWLWMCVGIVFIRPYSRIKRTGTEIS